MEEKTFRYGWDSTLFACSISFNIYVYIDSLLHLFHLKCRVQTQGTNLCAYYVIENIHGLVCPQKTEGEWEKEVSKKLYHSCMQPIL